MHCLCNKMVNLLLYSSDREVTGCESSEYD